MPIGECKGVSGGHLHQESFPPYKDAFPDLPFRLVVTTRSANAGARTGKAEVDGSDPPFFLPSAGAGVWRNLHLRHTPWGGRSRPKYPCGKAPEKNPEYLLGLCQASILDTRCRIQA